jgi:hypothetical protein
VDGKVAVYPKEDSRFNPSALLKAVFDSGVSVAEMTLVASGELIRDPARGLLFKVSNSVVFEVKPNDVSLKLKDRVGPGKPLRLRGLLYRKTNGVSARNLPASMPIEILEVLN